MEKKIKMPDIKGKIKEKSEKMPDIKGKIKEKSEKIPDIKGKIKEKSEKMPDIKGKIKEKSAKMPDIKGKIKEKSVKMPDMKAKIKEKKNESGNSALLVNELESNVIISNALIVCIIVMIFSLILNILGIFVIKMNIMIIASLVTTICMLIPITIVRVLKKEETWVKYVIIGACVVAIGTLSATLTMYVIAFYIFPVVVSTIYCSKKVNYITITATIVATVIGQVLGYVLNTTPDLNVKNVFDLVVLFMMPRELIVIAVGIILTSICERISTILGKFINANEEKVLLERSAQIASETADMSSELYDSVSQLSETSYTVTKISQRIANETEVVVQVTAESKENMNEVSNGVFQIDGQIVGLNDKCEKVTALATDIRSVAHENSKKIKRASDSMRLINKSNDECIDVIKLLEEQASKIMEITKSISEISSQTNMLSLNASIEAARAGEHGKGFFVVAEEIQQLSVQTRKAVDNIASIMDVIMESTDDAIEAMERSYKLTQSGLEHMQQVQVDAEYIKNSNTQMSEDVVDISGITRNIKKHSNEIMQHCEAFSKLIDRNFESVQLVSAVTEESSASAEVLQEMVYSIKGVAKKLSDIAQV